MPTRYCFRDMLDERARSRAVRMILRPVALLLLLLLLFAAKPALAAKQLKVGVFQFPPLAYTNERGEHAGLFIDLIREIAQREGWELVFVPGSWSDGFEKMRNGQLDLMPCVQQRPEREVFLDYPKEPAFVVWGQVLVRNHSKISGIFDLSDKKIGLMKEDANGKNFLSLMDNFHISVKPVIYPGFSEIASAIENGEVDGGVFTNTSGHSFLDAKNLKASQIVFSPADLKFATAKGINAEVLATLDRYLSEWKKDRHSPYYRLQNKYFSSAPQEIEYLWKYIVPTLLSCIAIALVLIIWRSALRRQVKRQTKQLREELALRAKAEEDLRKTTIVSTELAQRLELATKSAHLGIWDWNIRTNEMIWDDRMLELYGLTREDFPGGFKAWEQGLYPDDFSNAMAETQAALRGERDFNTEFRIQRPDGTVLHIKAHGIVLHDETGEPLRMIGLNTDITQRKREEENFKALQERLQRAEKMEALGTLAGGVAHDLNNVLGIVVGYAEMVLDEIDEANPLRNDVMKIMESGNRSAAIVQDLLTLARRGVQTKKAVNINALILDCQKTPEFEKVLSSNPKVQIKMDLEADILNVMGSPVHLSKTIMNLVSNAVEAMAADGALVIRTNNQYLDRPIQGYDAVREGDYVVLTVADTGEGISERDIQHIFEPFYTKKAMGRSGTGLGLSVVWGTVKDHNGYIDVQSKEGKGTTFTLYFPVTREDVAHDQISKSISEYMGQGEAILIVDDVKGQRELAFRMLAKLNYNVATAESGEEAIEYMKTNKADLIVLDMIMDPGIDGLETYEKILEISPTQKAIIVSGFSESDRVKQAQNLGAGPYIKKPYVLEKIGIAIREELSRK